MHTMIPSNSNNFFSLPGRIIICLKNRIKQPSHFYSRVAVASDKSSGVLMDRNMPRSAVPPKFPAARRFFGRVTGQEVTIKNGSRFPIIVAVSSDPNAYTTVTAGVGGKGVSISRVRNTVVQQLKSVAAGSESVIHIDGTYCYLTVARKSTTEENYHFARLNRKTSSGDTWVASDAMFDPTSLVAKSPTFMA